MDGGEKGPLTLTRRGLDSAAWTTRGSIPLLAIQVVVDERKLSMPPGISPYLFVVTKRIEDPVMGIQHISMGKCSGGMALLIRSSTHG